jgi:hypothetical protein
MYIFIYIYIYIYIYVYLYIHIHIEGLGDEYLYSDMQALVLVLHAQVKDFHGRQKHEKILENENEKKKIDKKNEFFKRRKNSGKCRFF